ncbi:MAG: hypothetical protein VCB42_05545 [Myxococcota bacterium]
MRRLWPAGVGLALAIALAILVKPDSTLNRVGNLNLGDSKFRDTYLVMHRSEADRCFVVNRRDATIRRSNDKQPGRNWRCHRISSQDPESPPAWLVQSKREGKGTVFFVPASRIADWSFPFFYEVARAEHPDAQLPLVEWTQLYVSRLYQGLYLRVDLPFDRRKKDGGSGVLREILSISGDSASVVDTRFDDAPGLYTEAIAAGVFPKLEKPLPDIAWLAEHAPTAGTTFLISNSEDFLVSLLPLPIGLPALFKARYGRSPATFTDRRFDRWTQGAWRQEAKEPKQWVSQPRFRESFDVYISELRRALQVDALARGHSMKPGQWKHRQAAAESLDFVKGES